MFVVGKVVRNEEVVFVIFRYELNIFGLIVDYVVKWEVGRFVMFNRIVEYSIVD